MAARDRDTPHHERTGAQGEPPCLLGAIGEPAGRIERILDQDLTQLNSQCPDVHGVRYFEIAGVGRRRLTPTSLALLPTAMILPLCGEARHDGVVGVRSACRNRPPLALWDEDHPGLIGHDLDWPLAPPSVEHFSRYERLAASIAASR